MNKSIFSLYTPQKKIRVEEEKAFPDYCSDIVRILKTDAVPYITYEKGVIKDGSVITDVSGRVDFTVVYLGGEGYPESYTFSSDFRDSIKSALPEDSDEECIFTLIDVSVDNIYCKAQNPRRVNVKCDAVIDTKVKTNSLFESIDPKKDKDKIERKTEFVNCSSLVSNSSEVFEFSEEIKLPERSPLMERILSCKADINCDSSSVSDGKLNFWATLSVNCLYLSESDGERECSTESFYQPIELAESIECYDLNKDSHYILRLTPQSLTASITTDNLGLNRVLEVKGSYTAHYALLDDNKLELTTDAYGVGCNASLSEEKRIFKSFPGTLRQTTAIREKIPLKDTADKLEGISGDIRVVNWGWENERLVANCKVRLTAVGISEDKESSVNTELDLTVPLNLPSELTGGETEKTADISVSVGYIDSKIYGDSAELSFDVVTIADVFVENEVSFISAVSLSDKEIKEEREVFVYPLVNDTLWSMGKRYGVSQSDLEKTNAITDGKPKRVMKIPR